MVSADATSERMLLGLNAGALDYITKPYNQAILLARIGSAVRIKQMQNDL